MNPKLFFYRVTPKSEEEKKSIKYKQEADRINGVYMSDLSKAFQEYQKAQTVAYRKYLASMHEAYVTRCTL